MADCVQFDIDTRSFARAMQRFINTSGRGTDEVAQSTMLNVLRDTKEGWPVDEGISINDWQGPTRIGPSAYEIRNTAVYARVIEFGGYPGVGPKTARRGAQQLAPGIRTNAGIYPTQRPAAPTRRALARNQLMMATETAQMLQQEWRRL